MIRADPALRAELALCDRWGIPHSTWCTWDPLDQAKALAYTEWAAEDAAARCGRCGTRHSDWFDPETQRPWPHALWRSEVAVCEGCRQARMLHGSGDDKLGPGEYVRLVPNTGPDPDL